MWKAIIIQQIHFKGKTYRERDAVQDLTDEEMRRLLGAGVIGDIKRMPEVETAVVAPAEDASRNYRRRPR